MWYNLLINLCQVRFTLHPAHSTVGRGNLVLRHSVPHFLPNSLGIACWQNSTPRFPSTPERRNGNINLNKHFISSSGVEPTTSRSYSHTLCPCATTHWLWSYHNTKYKYIYVYTCNEEISWAPLFDRDRYIHSCTRKEPSLHFICIQQTRQMRITNSLPYNSASRCIPHTAG